MATQESVDEILKEIVIKAVTEYLEQPVNPNLPKTNTKKNIAAKTGISESTLNRYTNPDANSYPNLVEVLEILRVTNKRQYLMDFANKSKCQAAQFIKEFYPKYINEHQIQNDVAESLSSNEEVLRFMNEHHSIMDKKQKTQANWVIWTLGALIICSHYVIIWEILEIKGLLIKK